MRRPFADRIFTKLKYAESYGVTTGIAGVKIKAATYKTSIFDPNAEMGGHQPMWRDQYAGIYGSYRVRGIKYRVTAALSANVNTNWWLGVRAFNSATDPDPNIQQWIERRDAIVKQGNGSFGNSGMLSLKGYLNVAKTRGVSRREVAIDNRYAAVMGSDPELMSFLHVGVQSITDNTVIYLTFRLTYYVEMFDLLTPGQS